MDPENIERQMKIKLSSKQFAEETIRNLEKYVDVVDKINPLYTEVTKLIISIDKYYTQERSDLWRAKLLVKEWRMNQRDINERIRAIEKKSTVFEIEQVDINMSLRKVIKNFPSFKDKLEHTKKTNEFCKLFMDIYTDLDNICVAYGQLLRKANR